jgi:hypothetical protein
LVAAFREQQQASASEAAFPERRRRVTAPKKTTTMTTAQQMTRSSSMTLVPNDVHCSPPPTGPAAADVYGLAQQQQQHGKKPPAAAVVVSGDESASDELSARSRVIARKVWFLRHGVLCLGRRCQPRCGLVACPKAVELVTHMRQCGAMADPAAGCRSPSCLYASKLLHHPRTCTRLAHDCAVCCLVRKAGTHGAGLLIPKDMLLNIDEVGSHPPVEALPLAQGGRARAYSECAASPSSRSRKEEAGRRLLQEKSSSNVVPPFPNLVEQHAVFDSDGFAVPAPRLPARKRGRTWSGDYSTDLTVLLNASSTPNQTNR